MTVNMDEMYHYLPEPLPGKRLTVGKTVQAERFIREFLDIVFPEPSFIASDTATLCLLHHTPYWQEVEDGESSFMYHILSSYVQTFLQQAR